MGKPPEKPKTLGPQPEDDDQTKENQVSSANSKLVSAISASLLKLLKKLYLYKSLISLVTFLLSTLTMGRK